MTKKLLFFIALIRMCSSYAQVACPTLNGPFEGDMKVPVDTSISWSSVANVPGYLISIGTTPGGTNIINNWNTGSATTYQPPLGLPENTPIYVTLSIFFFNAENIECTTEMFRTEAVTTPPSCTMIRSPLNEASNVNVGSPIVWDYAPTATSYNLTIGTTNGGGDILNNLNVGNVLSYAPITDLPFGTKIFVQVTPENENGSVPGGCTQTSFTTGEFATIPNCASLTSPEPSSINVPLTPRLEWTDVPEADGYRVTIGMSPDTAEILDKAIFTTNSTLVLDFDPNRTFFITIVPFNTSGEAIGCTQETFSTLLGCGPYLDAITGELVDLAPEIKFSDTVTFCQNEVPFTISTEDVAEGYRWFKVDTNGNETLISSSMSVDLTEEGFYRHEIFNTVSQSGNTVECTNSKEFTVVASEIATISSLNVTGQNGSIRIAAQVSGNGDYEYALDNIDGPYQDSNIFEDLPFGSYTVYVRDKNGCGVAEERVAQDLTLEGFPKFFTPNGDGVNDYWQFIPLADTGEIDIGTIRIFDRYGMLIKQIEPQTLGWDGMFDGKPLPASDYWYIVALGNKREFKGHFSLKR